MTDEIIDPDDMPSMTLRRLAELIQPLLERFGDYEVKTEGCDCSGSVCAIDLTGGDAYLRRPSFGVRSVRDPVRSEVMLPDPVE